MIQTFKNNDFKISVYGTIDQPYFKACEIAKLLGYKNTRKAVRDHIESEDKFSYVKNKEEFSVPLLKLCPQTVFINESGLYSLILSSKLPKAKEFKHWITNEVLPSIRKTGQYFHKDVKPKIFFNCQTESDLQQAIVNYLRTKYPALYFTANLGELQDTEIKRIKSYQMGYQKGSPDLMVFHRNRKFDGLAIEFKTPQGTGKLSDEQSKVLNALMNQKWDVLVSNDLFEITEKICKHMYQYPIPPKKQKKPKKQSIDEAELEAFNMEGLIDHYEDEGEFEIAEALASHMS